MKSITIALAGLVVVAFTACNGGSTGLSKANTKITNEKDSIAYALGHSIGGNLSNQFPGINPNIIANAIVEAYNGEENKLYASSKEADTAIRAYLKSESDRTANENKEKGEEFLAENAKKEGIKITDSGLQYEIIKEGDGPKPTKENTVSVMYHGTTIDGEVFDSSVERGDTVSFPVTGVIKGWTEGLQLMNVGSKYRFYIPSDLAYGKRGAGGKIGPNSALIFDVELIDIKK